MQFLTVRVIIIGRFVRYSEPVCCGRTVVIVSMDKGIRLYFLLDLLCCW